MVVMDLLRCTGADVVLIEPGEPGPGLAYGTAEPWHLLNSRAGAMSADPDGPGHFVLRVEYAGPARTFGAVVNCAGPGRLPRSAGPFVAGLLSAGLARVGPHALGLDVDPAGRLVAADGSVPAGLWVVGPLRRGALWETTAVPEIRAQARRLAGELGAARPEPLREAA